MGKNGMKVLKPEHIGIAIKDLEEGIKFYNDVLGLKLYGRNVLPDRNIEIAQIACGDMELELVQPTSPDSPVAKQIEEKGQGIYHLALQVENIEEALAELKEKGLQLRDQTPRQGLGGARIAFMEPESAFGVTFELIERNDP